MTISRISRLSRRSLLQLGLQAGGTALAAPFVLRAATRPAHAAAPMLGTGRPAFNRFKLGAFEITTVFDGGVALEGPHPIFGQDQPADAVEALAVENHLPPTRMEIGFTPVIVNTGSELIVFDTGNGAGRRPAAGNFASALRAAGYAPEQVDTVVITHMHPDHIGGLMEGDAPLFANARYVTGAREYDFWSADDRLSGPTEGAARLVRSHVMPHAAKTTFLKPGDDVASGVTAVEAHGHTPGHMAYHLESEGRRLLVWADTANHFVVSVQRPDWHVRFDMDKEQAGQTRKRLFDMAAADRIPVTGYHMPFPAVGYLEKRGDGYRWVQAAYELYL
ncbi:MBL fold metallo-hydrolase [Breoghania sp. JC706]|uniref:MBL fold metallo-hydrolase n=1 Tax=Breoghania sp. JC706 TaxID=3117732 RepID=UPI0030095151